MTNYYVMRNLYICNDICTLFETGNHSNTHTHQMQIPHVLTGVRKLSSLSFDTNITLVHRKIKLDVLFVRVLVFFPSYRHTEMRGKEEIRENKVKIN